MSEVSGYLVGEIEKSVDAAFSLLSEHLAAGEKRIKGKEKAQEYREALSKCHEKMEDIIELHPGDKEIKDFHERLFSFYVEQKEKESYEKKDKEKLLKLLEEIREISQWRKIEHASGERLPFGDFRSMREEYKRR